MKPGRAIPINNDKNNPIRRLFDLSAPIFRGRLYTADYDPLWLRQSFHGFSNWFLAIAISPWKSLTLETSLLHSSFERHLNLWIGGMDWLLKMFDWASIKSAILIPLRSLFRRNRYLASISLYEIFTISNLFLRWDGERGIGCISMLFLWSFMKF